MSLDERGQEMNDQFSIRLPRRRINEYRRPSSRLNALRYPDVNWLDEMTGLSASTINANQIFRAVRVFVKYFASVDATKLPIFKGVNDGKIDHARYYYNRFNFAPTSTTTSRPRPMLSYAFKLGAAMSHKNKPLRRR